MNVLVLNGSPKCQRSNTMRLTRSFLEGAGWAKAEIIDIAKMDINPCLGCFSCWSKTPGKCIINDEMTGILAKITAADVLIWSFPLYYCSVPGGLKTLIDRQLPLNLPFMAEGSESGSHPPRHDLSHQLKLIISTCGFWTASGNYDTVSSMFDRIYGKDQYTAIYCGQGELFRIPELKNRTDAYLDLVSRAGEEYVTGEIHKETMKNLAQPLYPRKVFEQMADASWGVQKKEDSAATADDSLQFTTQMAALYKPDGIERILELYYTDIGKTYQILMTKRASCIITEAFRPYTTRIETPYTLWRAIARNEISGQEALFQHRYKVLGDFSLMLKWNDLLGTSASSMKRSESHRPSNMMLLLAPWIVIWIAMAINPIVGGAAGIAAIAAVPLLWLRYRPVLYERITIPLVAVLSLAALLGIDERLVVPGSYLILGLLWFLGAFPSIPLSAHYSAEDYGGEKAFSNPLFIRTNRILTLCWSGLYLITPFWTYPLMGTALSPYSGLINSILPAFLGIFTAWFQKWYPGYYARG